LPIGLEGLGQDGVWALAHRISWMFASAMLLALPAVTAVLIVNISFGVMTRAAPQMNIFALGFPIGLIFGLFAIWVLHANFLPHFDQYTRETFDFMRALQGQP